MSVNHTDFLMFILASYSVFFFFFFCASLTQFVLLSFNFLLNNYPECKYWKTTR